MNQLDPHKDILKSHNLRITDCRIDVVQYFLEEKKALSQGDLESKFTQYDRVTLYRTLNSFLDSGILHKIPNATGVATYGLCHETCSPEHHDHNHIHFKCNNCGQIECLDDKIVPSVTVPTGYHIEAVNMIVDGICAKCA
ncbi:Fur family transcriptional regulator [Ekhidna sp. To15]|uniref:Fur family transcriptional regulator n=1 Tax=Ekhidna sp. To15 TaxID=3395267 RepID=UPI003F51FF19